LPHCVHIGAYAVVIRCHTQQIPARFLPLTPSHQLFSPHPLPLCSHTPCRGGRLSGPRNTCGSMPSQTDKKDLYLIYLSLLYSVPSSLGRSTRVYPHNPRSRNRITPPSFLGPRNPPSLPDAPSHVRSVPMCPAPSPAPQRPAMACLSGLQSQRNPANSSKFPTESEKLSSCYQTHETRGHGPVIHSGTARHVRFALISVCGSGLANPTGLPPTCDCSTRPGRSTRGRRDAGPGLRVAGPQHGAGCGTAFTGGPDRERLRRMCGVRDSGRPWVPRMSHNEPAREGPGDGAPS
jgi:hypothetical protein